MSFVIWFTGFPPAVVVLAYLAASHCHWLTTLKEFFSVTAIFHFWFADIMSYFGINEMGFHEGCASHKHMMGKPN